MENKDNKFKNLKEQLSILSTPLLDFRIESNYKPVIGEGNLFAKVMFIGEALGKNEAILGRPFIGAAGKILEDLLKQIGLSREEIFITSTVMDRPPNNRKPTPNEIEAYTPILLDLIKLISPKVIVTLGQTSTSHILSLSDYKFEVQSITKVHGDFIKITIDGQECELFPTFHPAYAIYRNEMKEIMQADFEKLKKRLA